MWLFRFYAAFPKKKKKKLNHQLRPFHLPFPSTLWKDSQSDSPVLLKATLHRHLKLVFEYGNDLQYTYFICVWQWHRNDTPSMILSRQAVYSVQAADVSHSGTYICLARNKQGHSQGNVSVTVTALPPTMNERLTTKQVTTGGPTTEVKQLIDHYYKN